MKFSGKKDFAVVCRPFHTFDENTIFCSKNILKKSCRPRLAGIYNYITLTGTAHTRGSLRRGRMHASTAPCKVVLEFYGGPGVCGFIFSDVDTTLRFSRFLRIVLARKIGFIKIEILDFMNLGQARLPSRASLATGSAQCLPENTTRRAALGVPD